MPTSDRAVLAELKRHGLLMQSDALLPSVASLVAGAPIRGSWWAHPLSHRIFATLQELEDHPDVLVVKLVSGKVTFVHRRLWPELLAVVRSNERWQTVRLGATARTLLARVRSPGPVRTDLLARSHAAAAKHLEQRLLVRASEVHTETGAHAKSLESWEQWAARSKASRITMPPADARERLERIVGALNERFRAAGRLPWQA